MNKSKGCVGTVCPDLAKFCQKFMTLGFFWWVYFVLGKVFENIFANFYAMGQIFIVENCKIFSNKSGHTGSIAALK